MLKTLLILKKHLTLKSQFADVQGPKRVVISEVSTYHSNKNLGRLKEILEAINSA